MSFLSLISVRKKTYELNLCYAAVTCLQNMQWTGYSR